MRDAPASEPVGWFTGERTGNDRRYRRLHGARATGGTVDARTDIFSFGAMLYEMLTGWRAFPGASTAETLSAVIRAQPTPPSAVVAEIPGDLEKVILRCLRKDPQRRYQHIDALACGPASHPQAEPVRGVSSSLDRLSKAVLY